jgi:hypothetical protein
VLTYVVVNGRDDGHEEAILDGLVLPVYGHVGGV